MLFTSFSFLAFLCVLFLLYYLIPKKMQWGLLLIASWIFYLFSGIENFAFILTTSVSAYIIALIISKRADREKSYLAVKAEEWDKEQRKAYKAKEKKKRFYILCAGLVFNFGILAVIKYTGFAVANINSFIAIFNSDSALAVPSLLLPLGISFYIFQTMGYLIDVYRGKAEVQKNYFKLALFVSFFPQLIQGPISRYNELSCDLYKPHAFDSRQFKFGLQRIMWGYFKKLVIADRVMVAIKTILGSPDEHQGMYVVALIFLYSIQIYADFTGGIDITIGIAESLGIKVTENFNRPFFSKSTQEYWKRWHITMGSWFTDYIFYPLSVCKPMMKLSKWSREKLGQNIGKRIPVYLATIVTWFLTGLWHGAGWNFIVWGLLNCLVLLTSQELEPIYRRWRNKFPRLTSSKPYALFMMTRTFWLMGTIRVLDCYRDVPTTFRMLGSVFVTPNWNELFNGKILDLGVSAPEYVLLALGGILMIIVSALGIKKSVRERLDGKPILSTAIFTSLLFVILIFGSYGLGNVPLIYGQF